MCVNNNQTICIVPYVFSELTNDCTLLLADIYAPHWQQWQYTYVTVSIFYMMCLGGTRCYYRSKWNLSTRMSIWLSLLGVAFLIQSVDPGGWANRLPVVGTRILHDIQLWCVFSLATTISISWITSFYQHLYNSQSKQLMIWSSVCILTATYIIVIVIYFREAYGQVWLCDLILTLIYVAYSISNCAIVSFFGFKFYYRLQRQKQNSEQRYTKLVIHPPQELARVPTIQPLPTITSGIILQMSEQKVGKEQEKEESQPPPPLQQQQPPPPPSPPKSSPPRLVRISPRQNHHTPPTPPSPIEIDIRNTNDGQQPSKDVVQQTPRRKTSSNPPLPQPPPISSSSSSSSKVNILLWRRGLRHVLVFLVMIQSSTLFVTILRIYQIVPELKLQYDQYQTTPNSPSLQSLIFSQVGLFISAYLSLNYVLSTHGAYEYCGYRPL